MKKLIIIIGLFLLTACATVKMSPKQAIDKMSEEENYIIVDVRTKEEYDEKHIKDAINIPLARCRMNSRIWMRISMSTVEAETEVIRQPDG